MRQEVQSPKSAQQLSGPLISFSTSSTIETTGNESSTHPSDLIILRRTSVCLERCCPCFSLASARPVRFAAASGVCSTGSRTDARDNSGASSDNDLKFGRYKLVQQTCCTSLLKTSFCATGQTS
eukprot:3556578-Pleurochrysis_carterae.AAC.2